MTIDPRCCGSGTCIVDPAGRCWCGQQWDVEKTCKPEPAAQQDTERQPESRGTAPQPDAWMNRVRSANAKPSARPAPAMRQGLRISKLTLDVFNDVTDLSSVANGAIAPGGNNAEVFRFTQQDPHAADTFCRHRRNP